MYIMIVGKDGGTLYMNMPEQPTITICKNEDGDYIAAVQIDDSGEGMVIDVGLKHEVHETVNKLLTKLNLKPEKL